MRVEKEEKEDVKEGEDDEDDDDGWAMDTPITHSPTPRIITIYPMKMM